MPKKIQYVSEKLVFGEYCDFRDKRLALIEAKVSGKYKIYFSRVQLHTIAASVCGGLAVALYLKCARYRDFPSYQHQLLLIRDFRQLLKNIEPKPQYIHLSDYRHCYDRLCSFLSERIHYAESGILSETFFSQLSLSNESFPMEHAEKYLDYTEEITRVVIEEMTNMVLEQIFTFFPSEGPAFYQSLFPEVAATVTVDENNANHSEIGRRVTFAIH